MNLSYLSIAALRRELLREPCMQVSHQPNVVCEAVGMYGAPWPPIPLVDYRLAVAKEILLRGAYADAVGSDILDSPNAARAYFQLALADLKYEAFLVAYLDAGNRVIAIEEAFRGTTTCTYVHPKEIARKAVLLGAFGIIACHQHPAGDNRPSRADETLSSAIKSALALLDVKFLDHLIYGNGKFGSMAELGYM